MQTFGDWFDPYDPAPPYRQIAALIRAEIESGQLAPGTPLPSEKTLEQTYGVARETARRAVRALREEGLAVTIPGRGSYVAPDYQRPARPTEAPPRTDKTSGRAKPDRTTKTPPAGTRGARPRGKDSPSS